MSTVKFVTLVALVAVTTLPEPLVTAEFVKMTWQFLIAPAESK